MKKFAAGCGVCLLILLAAFGGTQFCQYLHERDLTELYAMSNSDHGDTIEAFITGVAKEEVEICAVFDQAGRKLIEFTRNQAHYSALPAEAIEILSHEENLTHIHNHPNSDSPFSDGDLRLLTTQYSFAKLIVRAQEHVYYLDSGDAEKPNPRQIEDFIQSTAAYAAMVLGPENQESFVLSDDGTGYYSTEKFLQEYVKRFGLSFWSEPALRFGTAA